MRVTPASSSSILKLRMSTLMLRSMDTVDVTAARMAAARARLDVADGKDPRQDVAVYAHAMARTNGKHEAAADAAWPVEVERQSDDSRRRVGPWRGRDLVDLFLARKEKYLDPVWFAEYTRFLRHLAFDRIATRLVRDVTLEHLEGIRDRILETNAPSRASRAVRQGREMLDWAWANHGSKAGLSRKSVPYPWWRD